MPSPFDEELKELRDEYAKNGFILQLGCFKYSGRFYGANQFHKPDIVFVIKQLGWKYWEYKVAYFQENYSLQASYKYRLKILALSGWSSFEEKQTEFNRSGEPSSDSFVD